MEELGEAAECGRGLGVGGFEPGGPSGEPGFGGSGGSGEEAGGRTVSGEEGGSQFFFEAMEERWERASVAQGLEGSSAR